MPKYRPPYRIVRAFEKLSERKELKHCDIHYEELDIDRAEEAGCFPLIQYDTVRVFVKYRGFTVNVLGKIESGQFWYEANGYLDDNTPWNPSHHASIDKLDELIDLVVQKFDSVPKDAHD